MNSMLERLGTFAARRSWIVIIGWLIIPIMMVTHYSYRLSVVPDDLQGRVNSVFKLVAYGGEPIALAFTGILLQSLGAVPTIFIISVPQIAVSIAATLYRPLREAPALTELSSR